MYMQLNQSNNKHQRGKGIVHVGELFKKYTNTLRAPQGIVITAFIEAVKDECGVVLRDAQCTYTVATGTLNIHASGMIKTEITLHKKDIFEHMKNTIGEKNLPKNIL